MDEWCEQLVQVGGSRATGRNRPGDPHFRNWWHEHRLDKILTPRSPPLTRTYTIFSEPIKQYITRRLYVYVVKTHPIWGFCGRQEGTVHTRTLTYLHTHANQLSQTTVLWAPRSVRKTTVNSATDRLLRCERHARQLLEPKAFSPMKSFFSCWNYKLRFYQNWHFFFQPVRCNNGVGSGDIYPFLLQQV